MRRARLIYNPTSGREEVRKRLAEILEAMEEMGYESSAFATKGTGDAVREARRACQDGYDLIVASGGDGTLNEVVTGMADELRRPRLGILPMGTTNDFARAMGIPRDLKKALVVLKEEHSKWIDIGKMNEKYFINIAGGGSLTELTYQVPSKMKTLMGPMAYYLKGMEKLANIKSFELEMDIDGKTKREKVVMFLVTNTNSVGGFEKLSPDSDSSDGLFDVFILKEVKLAKYTQLLQKILIGSHMKDAKIIHFKTDSLTVRTKVPLPLNLDGEYGGVTPAHFEMLPRHIEFIVRNDG